MSHHIGLQVLRAKVRGFQASGQSLTHLISKTEKERKSNLWNKKRDLGKFARLHLIAYGLLRGIPYERIEKCAKDNRPNPQQVFEIIKEHSKNVWKPFMVDGKQHGCRLDEWTLERVRELLTVKDAVAEPVAASEPCSTATVASQQIQSQEPPPRSILDRLVALTRPQEKRA